MLVRQDCSSSKQHGGDQRARVADADPPDEDDDRKAPADRDVDAPDADAAGDQVDHADQEDLHEHERKRQPEEPAARHPLREDDRADLVGDRTVAMARRKNGALRRCGSRRSLIAVGRGHRGRLGCYRYRKLA